MAYVYRHIRLDKNEPFYIGIGTDLSYARANEKTRRNNIWKKIVSKTKYEIEILFDSVDLSFAKQKEIEFIKLYGRIDVKTGCLSNMTDGGDGTINKVYTLEYRKKLSDRAKQRGPQPQLQKIIEYRKTKFEFTPEIRAKISLSLTGRKLSDEHKLKLKDRRGEKNPMYGKKNYNHKGVILVFLNGVVCGEYDGVYDCAHKLNLSASKISACLTGRRNKTGGYTFRRK